MRVGEVLEKTPFREITTVVRITDHDPGRVWGEMDEYVPTDRVKQHFRDVLDALADTHRGPTERVCVWVSGFFGSGKSHFLKVLGYVLEDRELQDDDGAAHSSCEFLCHKLGLETFVPLLTKQFGTKVLFINLLDHDPQSPERPTISRLIYRRVLEQKGLSTDFWVAEREKDLQKLGKWDEFQDWVQEKYGRRWEEERRLNAEVVLKQALPKLQPTRFRTEEDAAREIRNNKRRFSTVDPSDVVAALHEEAQELHEHNGRIVVLLDEVGLYVGDSVDRLANLNRLAEQVVEHGEGKVLLIATAQEALPELVTRLTTDRHILEWLRDRFRLRCGLVPTEVQTVVAKRLLSKTSEGAGHLEQLYQAHQGALLANLSIDRSWDQGEFVQLYPLPPYSVALMQDIMGTMRGSPEEMRRLSGSERSMLKLAQVVLTGEGGVTQGAEQELGWLATLDLFYDALAPDLVFVRSEQVRVIRELEQLGDASGLPVARVAKALFLLQHVRQRYPCTAENIASALVDRVETDINSLRRAVQQGFEKLLEEGWLVEEDGEYRLLNPTEHDLERDVRANYPRPSELKDGAVKLLRDMLGQLRYEHGRMRRPLRVAIEVDGHTIQEEGELAVELFTPFTEESQNDVLGHSISWPDTLFWKAGTQVEIKPVLERTIAIEKTLEQWRTRSLTPEQDEHRSRLDREAQTARQTKLPQIVQQAFLNGRLFRGGQELSPSGTDVAPLLRTHLREIASRLYTEFVDDRPERDEDCASILSWQPGTVLPEIYGRRGLLTSANQINRDAGLLAIVKAQLTRREQLGLARTGKDLLEHFEKKPYGWDPRLVRVLFATLFKAGVVSVNFQSRDLTDPTDAQARPAFVNKRQFGKATFALLPEVNWRQASQVCSRLFGVHGGDTFERTAAIVRRQASHWSQEAQTLATRCRDNGLPASFGATSAQAAQALSDISRLRDPNARLRRLLEGLDDLDPQMSLVRRLREFAFDEYRMARTFLQTGGDWATSLSGEVAQRWARLQKDLAGADLLDRWDQLREDYGFLLSRYRADYVEQHQEFKAAVREALQRLQAHEAFQEKPDAAEAALQPVRTLACDAADHEPTEDVFRCATCQRSIAALSRTVVTEAARRVEAALDALMPKPPVETIKPLSIHRTVGEEAELDGMTDELRRYTRRAPRPVEVSIKAEVKEDGQ